MVSFQEVRGSKKSTCIAQQILACIRRREYKSGDRLPPERIIAEQMSTSRNAVREALSALQVLGIIESRHGNGTYIASSVDGNPGIGQVLLSVKESEDLFDLWEAREEIEAVIIRMAIHSATEKTIARVSYYLKKMNRAVKVNDTIEYIAMDKKFHLSIARGIDNILLKNIIQPLTLITNDYLLENIDVDRSKPIPIVKTKNRVV